MTREEMIRNLVEEMSECGIFVGKYDAKHGNRRYMYGIYTVMEWLAYKVSEEYGDEFSDTFFGNMHDSEDKA